MFDHMPRQFLPRLAFNSSGAKWATARLKPGLPRWARADTCPTSVSGWWRFRAWPARSPPTRAEANCADLDDRKRNREPRPNGMNGTDRRHPSNHCVSGWVICRGVNCRLHLLHVFGFPRSGGDFRVVAPGVHFVHSGSALAACARRDETSRHAASPLTNATNEGKCASDEQSGERNEGIAAGPWIATRGPGRHSRETRESMIRTSSRPWSFPTRQGSRDSANVRGQDIASLPRKLGMADPQPCRTAHYLPRLGMSGAATRQPG